MAKNIIICSDGTGQQGGGASPTNVYRLYTMIDTHASQIALYDDGIGTESKNKLWQAFSRMFGFGFKKNIIFLYRFLAKHYEPGDKIFLFGFSRGAATVRALAGMIQKVGLLRNDYPGILTKEGVIDSLEMRVECYKAMYYYRKASSKPELAEEFKIKKTHGSVDIEIVGCWDTVSALGFPKDSSWLIIGLSKLIDIVSDKLMPHRYYEYQLDKNVRCAYHALSIDDERKSFHPMLWNEGLENRPQFIEQVWFPGSHSNIGGGYDRTELSSITLDWMIRNAKKHGLILYDYLHEEVFFEKNPAGKLYDSRKGLFRYYRYDPRHIRDLSNANSVDRIMIHSSAFERINLFDYYPVLPNNFDIVGDFEGHYEERSDEVKHWKKRVNKMTFARKINYHILVETTVLMGMLAWYLFKYGEQTDPGKEITYNIFVSSFPAFLEPFINYCIYQQPLVGLAFVAVIGFSVGANSVLKLLSDRLYKRINWSLLRPVN